MTSPQAQAQFDWLQERFKDPTFAGIAFSGTGDFISGTELRKIKTPEELEEVFAAHRFPLVPREKDVGNSQQID